MIRQTIVLSFTLSCRGRASFPTDRFLRAASVGLWNNNHNYNIPSLCRTSHTCRRTLVTQLSPTTSLLRSERRDNEVYLIGTAHISQTSATEVKDLIQQVVHPRTVMVELDAARAAQLWSQQQQSQHDPLEEQFTRTAQQFWTQHMPALPAVWQQPQNHGHTHTQEEFVANYIRGFYQMLRRYGFVPGVDMLAGMQAAKEIGAQLVYGDQNGNTTMRKLSATLHPTMILQAMTTPMPTSLQTTLYEIMQSIINSHNKSSMGTEWQQNLQNRVEDMKTRAAAQEMTRWMQQAFPATARVLIQERDVIMAHNLQRYCGTGRVVAVVGIAHMDGVEREWSRLEKEENQA